MKHSIIICTYNPKESVFNSCLEHIQTALEQYAPDELLIIDNNSLEPIRTKYEGLLNAFNNKLSVKVITETKQGLTNARLRGIQEADGDVLIYLDDDNFIQADYFYQVDQVSMKHPNIGAFSGDVSLIYEEEPPEWVHRYNGMLVYRNLQQDKWSNLISCGESVPCGAGLVVLKSVAQYYLNLTIDGKRPILLDRSKDSLLSGGDNDLAYCATALNLGMGVFKDIKLAHFIPKERVSIPYLTELTKWISASTVVLEWYWDLPAAVVPRSRFNNLLINTYHFIRKSKIEWGFHKATMDGRRIGTKIVTDYENTQHR